MKKIPLWKRLGLPGPLRPRVNGKKTNPYRWAILAGHRDDLTIDRIDWRGGYCPGNCRWATYSQQASKTRRRQKWYNTRQWTRMP